MCCPQLCSHCGWLLLKCSAIGIGFNGAETNCRIAHILGILLMNSCNTDKFLATTIICSLSTLNPLSFPVCSCEGCGNLLLSFSIVPLSVMRCKWFCTVNYTCHHNLYHNLYFNSTKIKAKKVVVSRHVYQVTAQLQSNPANSKSQGKWKKKFEIARFRNNGGSVKFVTVNTVQSIIKKDTDQNT